MANVDLFTVMDKYEAPWFPEYKLSIGPEGLEWNATMKYNNGDVEAVESVRLNYKIMNDGGEEAALHLEHELDICKKDISSVVSCCHMLFQESKLRGVDIHLTDKHGFVDIQHQS